MKNFFMTQYKHSEQSKFIQLYFPRKCVESIAGFTIVELLVSVTLFSIAMTISISTLLIIIDANAKAQAVNAAMTNLSFAIDSMTREIRTGYNHYCASSGDTDITNLTNSPAPRQDCVNGQDPGGIAFNREKNGDRIGYRLNTINGHGRIEVGGFYSSGWLPITSPDVDIERFVPFVDGMADAYKQPEITILIEGTVNNGLDTPTDFSTQTSVTQKIIDL